MEMLREQLEAEYNLKSVASSSLGQDFLSPQLICLFFPFSFLFLPLFVCLFACLVVCCSVACAQTRALGHEGEGVGGGIPPPSTGS